MTPGAAATYTATVSGLNAASADSATVNLLDGTSNIGMANLTKAAGTATTGTVTFNVALPAGTHNLTAMYMGDANSTASTSAVLVVTSTAAAATSATALTGPTSVTPGVPPPTRRRVSGLNAASADSATVNLLDGTSNIGMATLTKAAGTATTGTVTFNVTLPAGTHNLTAMYMGDANSTASTSAVLVVTSTAAAATSATVLTGPTSVTPGAAATYTATVSGLNAASADSATVNLLDGTSNIGMATLTKAAGTATTGTVTFNVTLPAGTHNLKAMYMGDANSTASTSAVLVVTSTAAPVPSFSLTPASTSLTSAAGATVTDVVTVNAVNGFTGNVSFASCTVTANFAAAATNVTPTCTASPSTVTLGTSATTTLSISSVLPKDIAGQGFASGKPSDLKPAVEGLATLALLIAMFPAGSRRRILRSGKLLTLALVLAGTGLLALTGCGGGNNTFHPQPVGTASGGYTVTLTATGTPAGGAAVTQTSTIPLVIQ